MEPVAPAVAIAVAIPAMACEMSEEKETEVWSSESSGSR